MQSVLVCTGTSVMQSCDFCMEVLSLAVVYKTPVNSNERDLSPHTSQTICFLKWIKTGVQIWNYCIIPSYHRKRGQALCSWYLFTIGGLQKHPLVLTSKLRNLGRFNWRYGAVSNKHWTWPSIRSLKSYGHLFLNIESVLHWQNSDFRDFWSQSGGHDEILTILCVRKIARLLLPWASYKYIHIQRFMECWRLGMD